MPIRSCPTDRYSLRAAVIRWLLHHKTYKMKRHIAALLAVFIASTSFGQQVEKVTIGDNMNYGITYSLPVTALQVHVTARCAKTVAGQYAMYAEKFLGLHDVALTDRTECELSGIRLETVAKADPVNTFHISFPEKGALPAFYLTDEHCLWGINMAPTPTTPEVVRPAEVAKPLAYRPTDVLTSDILKAGSKSKQAELIAQEIFSIRESRSELIRGEADNTPNDGRQLQLMLDNLTAQEEALLSFFVGTTTVTEVARTYTYVPQGEAEHEVVFRFSTEYGLVDADDLVGAPYYASVSVIEDNRLPELDPKLRKKVEKGIAFCVPGKAHVRIFDVDGPLTEGDIWMAQFGHVEQLPQMQFTDKKKPCSALFTPSTGALKIFEQ